MKYLLLLLLGLFASEVFGQQPLPISIRENFFNKYTYSQNGIRINSNQVKASMSDYPATLKKYLVGQRNMTIGSGMRIATAVLLTSGIIYFLADDYSIRSRNVFLVTTVAGTVLGVIGPGIREEGKRNVSDAIQEYNFQVLRNPDFQINQKSLQVRNPYAVGWKFNF